VPSPARSPAPIASSWQQELAGAVSSIDELAAALGLPVHALLRGRTAAQRFPIRVPRGFVGRMRPGDPHDPLLLQVLATSQETIEHAGFVADPLDELAHLRPPGLLHKYPRRALLLATGACAVHCRYCFRREFPYPGNALTAGDIPTVIRTLAADPSIGEIILSGGDPLTLANGRLDALLRALGGIDHLRRIRIHTRLPIVLPQRVDPGLARLLAACARPVVIVLHSNHPNEIDASVSAAAAALRSTGALLLNQSVLLRRINDDSATLAALSERLFAIGVTPYYLHMLDPVRGAAHFRVGERRARRLFGELTERLPGYLVPRLVRERPGMHSKEMLAPIRHNRPQVT
jgi:EF-P beta-lysylation protein EpmB